MNLDFLALTLLLAEHRGVVHLAPLGLELRTKQGLTALDQRALQRHADVARFDVFQDVILFPLEADVHLVLKVKRRFRVVVGAEVDFVADVAIDGQLNPLVKVESGDGPVALRQTRVFGPAVSDTKIQFGRSLGLDFNLVGAKNGLEQLGVHRQFGRKSALLIVDFLLHLIPEFAEVFIDVVFEEFVQGQEGRIPEVEGVSQTLTYHILSGGLIVIHPVFDHIGKVQTHTARGLHGVGVVLTMRQRQVQTVGLCPTQRRH